MTDAEIIQALDEFHRRVLKTNLSYHIRESEVMAIVDALDLINRQKAEIERLQKENNQFADIGKMYSEIKAEAIKEFAERLKEHKYQSSDWSHGEHPFVIEETDIDNLVEKMVGDT